MKLSGRATLEEALRDVGERLAFEGEACTIVVLVGAALNLLGVVDRPTIDVDVLARLDDDGRSLCPPDPLPVALCRAIVAVARDRGLAERWMNTAVAGQWRFGLPPGLAGRVAWREFGALRVGVVHRRDLVAFKLYASADQTGPDNVHTSDLIALRPTNAELSAAADWVGAQDPGPEFHETLGKVVAYVRAAVR